ncbi:Hsp70 family protein [Sorangium sp. So ce315]|uniref:Hsp70 family protein n=1 Tax=Sorangium sp. So ce315 TaxID=3133299 RepID=UPI003F619EB2
MSAPAKNPSLIVGIDLGTTHTVVAWAERDADPDAIRVFPIPQLVTATEVEARPLLPSLLYAPVPGEAPADPFGDAPFVLGEHARRRGGEIPGRLIASAKSWLCHPAVDRTAPILPWGAGDEATDLPRASPLDASARILAHVKRTWDEAFPDRPLAEQEVVLTVPASFDQVARELTVEAARRAGLSARLLEEPQAAFYDFMRLAGAGGLEALLARSGGEAMVLVCDVGGGTTDLSLIRVARRAGAAEGASGGPLPGGPLPGGPLPGGPPSSGPLPDASPVEVSRVAVGHHLLLGGDNMDLALAHLCEPRLVGAGEKLDPARFGQLVLACRAAKERLLGGAPPDADAAPAPPDDAPVTVLSHGARLVGGALTTRLGREEVERVVLDGFFPETPRDARPHRGRSGLVAFGLPYERDVAITRHVAWFFARHAPASRGPTALLLNGGVFRARRVAERLARAIERWGGPPLDMLPHADPDLAVARGAVAYGLALAGRGVRIEGGAARGYYVGLDPPAGGGPRPAVCVVPRGAKEGSVHAAAGRTFALVVGRPVRFDLFASDDAREDRAGDIVPLEDDRFEALPPVAVAFDAGAARARGEEEGGKRAEVRVQIEGELTAIGTLDLACVEVGAPAPRRFRLAFQLREDGRSGRAAGGAPAEGGAPAAEAGGGPPARPHAATPGGKRLDEAREAIERVFGKGRPDVAPREVKNLVRELERVLGERPTWTTETARALFDTLAPSARSRRRSADHERVFWSLAGYCLRPGFGDAGDPARIATIAPLFAERLAFPQEARSWQQFWIAWRRVAGGLDEPRQVAIRDLADPFLAPAEQRLKKPKGVKPEALDDLLELCASLERVPAGRRSELGAWLLERTWTDRDARLWAAIGRIGARVPAYASVHHVVSPAAAERWLDHLLREKWEGLPSAAPAAVQLARRTGDRARDVSDRIRGEVERRLVKAGAPEAWARAVREVVAVEEAERAAFFGEGLPVGLRLVSD